MKDFNVQIVLLHANGRSEYGHTVKAETSYDATIEALTLCKKEAGPVNVLRVVVHPRVESE